MGYRVGSVANNITATHTGNATNMAVSAVELFVVNEWGWILTYIASIFFGIPAVIMLLYNAINLGGLGPIFNISIPNGGMRYIIYLIPHGIFEITATVIQSAAGI